ncbi:hypothetical protein HHK36_010625 [Tetracentron sinense]|uniref:Alpha-SNAP n=1 Tax=Tetracentron sinense TaxID=13715 RepID=A0A834ZAT4_TETSI|nr:hypothetical protein HHK36_010625 [Tetracentron sinense]
MAGVFSVPNMKTLQIYTIKLRIASNLPNLLGGVKWNGLETRWIDNSITPQLDSKHEAAQAYVDAAKCFKKTSAKEAISCLEQAVNLYTEIGRFNMAARYCKEIGELYELEHNFERAIVYFERSADLFQSEEVTSSANQCKQKVAEFSAQLEQIMEEEPPLLNCEEIDIIITEEEMRWANRGNKAFGANRENKAFEGTNYGNVDWREFEDDDETQPRNKLMCRYPKAVEIYEEIARKSLNNNLLKYGVKGHLLNAGLCQLCRGDVVAITNSLERYQELDPTFSGTREYKFLADLAAAIDEEDIARFTDVVKEFDSMTRLDAWKTTLLLRAKESLKAKELEEDDLT